VNGRVFVQKNEKITKNVQKSSKIRKKHEKTEQQTMNYKQ
jgi:hypothetical protein